MVVTNLEPLSYMLLNGLIDLAYQAWAELEAEHKGEPYSPAWESYQRMEAENRLRFFSLREDAELIGYASIILDTDIHRNNILFSQFRDIFIVEGKRGHAPFFVNRIEQFMANLGARRSYIAERLNSPASLGPFLEASGYVPQERLWGKDISETLH